MKGNDQIGDTAIFHFSPCLWEEGYIVGGGSWDFGGFFFKACFFSFGWMAKKGWHWQVVFSWGTFRYLDVLQNMRCEDFTNHKNTQTLDVWYVHLHLVDFYGFHVGKYIIHWVSGIVFLSGSFVFSMFLWFCFLDGWISQEKNITKLMTTHDPFKGWYLGQPPSPLWHVDGGLETSLCEQASKSNNHNSKTQMLPCMDYLKLFTYIWCRIATFTCNSPRRVEQRKMFKHIGSMYGIFTYIWLIFMVNVGTYTIHGYYGKE